MLKKKIYYLLLILVILISCVVPYFVQSSTVYAATNQEKVNGIEYVNNDLGFSLTLPESWKGKYSVEANETSASFKVKLDQSYNEKYNNIYLFTIWVDDKESSETEGGEDFPIGNKNGKYYSISVDHALYSYDNYDEMFPEATEEERKRIETMFRQIKEIGNSFKILKEEGAVAEEATKQKTPNGIKYTNAKLGFELILPKFWKDHYIVEENDQGGVIFKFKFNGKVYEDIYLFNIYVANEEYSSEEQEELGDNGVLGVGNGKTYLITENLAMYAPPDVFDKHFSSVPVEARNVIKDMSKQKKILSFKVLEGVVGEEAKEGEVRDEQPPAKEKVSYEEFCNQFGGGGGDASNICNNFLTFRDFIGERIDAIPKQSRYIADRVWSEQNFSEQSDYSFYIEPRLATNRYLTRFYIIKTPIDNIRTEVIRKSVSETSYTGTNGGFLELDYDKETNEIYKLNSKNISYYSGAVGGLTDGSTENYNYNGTRQEPTPRPTFVTYYDRDLRKMKAEIIHDITSMDEINNHFKNLDHNDHKHHDNQVIINAIGGKSFDRAHWAYGKIADYYLKPARRTVLGYKEEGGNIYAYLMVTDTDITVAGLESFVESLGFNKDNIIVLDGSGSTSMRVKMPNGQWFIDKGKEPPLLDLIEDADRPVYNMIRLINDTPR
ncbi:hypothetical protein U8V97_13325 [Priestia filamentosa]|uniref:hypothetical protein n=1 Tax=Priestia filamentosa TaxID=1402861 RepID=UPI00397AA3C1